MTYEYEISHSSHGGVHVYDLSAWQTEGPLVAMQRDGEPVCDAVATLVVSEQYALLCVDTEAATNTNPVEAANYGFDADDPSHDETLAAIRAALIGELVEDEQVEVLDAIEAGIDIE